MHAAENRYESRLDANLAVTLDFGTGTQTCWVEDVSGGGMRIWFNGDAVEVGEEVEVLFRVPGHATAIRCDAEVMWRRGEQAGLLFTDLAAGDLHQLTNYMQHYRSQPWYL